MSRRGGLLGVVADVVALDGLEAQAGIEDREMSDRALRHEYGQGVPMRPFLRDTVAANANDWAVEMRPILMDTVADQGDEVTSMHRLGQRMAADIVETVAAGRFEPLDAETIEDKGNSNPLADSGRMLDAVTSRVVR